MTHEPLWKAVPASAVIAFFGFLGVEYASVIAPLVRDPARNVPIATLGGLAFAALVYVSMSGVIMGILPATVLARASAPVAAAAAPLLGALVAGAVALCAMIKACGALGAGILAAAETARSHAVTQPIGARAGSRPGRVKASPGNLVLIGVMMSLVTLASASPNLGRQFTIVANITVVLSMAVYAAACVALMLISDEARGRRRIVIRVCAVGGGLFSCGMIAASEADLLLWSAAAVAIAAGAYGLLRARP